MQKNTNSPIVSVAITGKRISITAGIDLKAVNNLLWILRHTKKENEQSQCPKKDPGGHLEKTRVSQENVLESSWQK